MIHPLRAYDEAAQSTARSIGLPIFGVYRRGSNRSRSPEDHPQGDDVDYLVVIENNERPWAGIAPNILATYKTGLDKRIDIATLSTHTVLNLTSARNPAGFRKDLRTIIREAIEGVSLPGSGNLAALFAQST